MEKRVEEFFEKYINGWMLGDVKICVDNNANFGAVTLICCYIDFLGKLYTGSNDTEDRFKKFINDFFDNKYDDYSKFIYKTFRCGMTHSFFPLKEGGVIGGYDRENEHLKYFNDEGKEGVLINMHILFDDFKQAISNYCEDLKKDPELRKIFLDTIEGILEEKNDSFKELKERIKSLKMEIKNKVKINTSGSVTIEVISPGTIPGSRSALSQDVIDKYNKKIN